MPKSTPSSFPWIPFLLGTSLVLHIFTVGYLFYTQYTNTSAFADIARQLSAHDTVLEEHDTQLAKNYVQNYNDNFAVRQDVSDLYALSDATWSSPYSLAHGDARISFSYLEPSEVISDPGDTDPEFVANYQDAYSVFYALNIEDITSADIAFENAQGTCDYYDLGSTAITVGTNTFCEKITDGLSHNILQREAIYTLVQGTTLYTLTFTARTGGTCQYEKEVSAACEAKYFAPMDAVVETLLSSFTTETL